MSAEIRYLSQRSLAVYEATVINRFSEMHRRNVQVQAIKFAVWTLTFILLAVMAIAIPVATQDFVKLFIEG